MSGSELKPKLAAILAADAAGYSRLMSLDERATVNALDAARKVFRTHIEFNQGRVIDMAGDSVLAVFETATGAVTAAMAIQAEVNALADAAPEEQRMRFRIGVHLGDLIEKDDGTVYGDGVNIAARLEGLAEPGGVTVSESIHAIVRGKVLATFVDQGQHQVKNIAHAVRAYRTSPPQSTTGSSAPALGNSASISARPCVAVLPFDNMSGDASQTYIAHGFTEDLITALSKYHWLRVVARNSCFAFKGQSVDVRRAARELGANYVVEGSVRKSGNRLRVTAQLIDGTSGKQIWAERYDRDLDDLFELQDEINTVIVGRLEPELGIAEQTRAIQKPTQNLGAWDCCHVGLSQMYQVTREGNVQAQAMLSRAVDLDARFAQAHARLAYCMVLDMVYFDARPTAEALDKALRHAKSAVALDGGDSFCSMALGRVHIARREFELGQAACKAAVAINPSIGTPIAVWVMPSRILADSQTPCRVSKKPFDSVRTTHGAGRSIRTARWR